jgi:hypothetical protein
VSGAEGARFGEVGVVGHQPLDEIIAPAVRHAIPAIYQLREFVEADLMSCGSSIADGYSQAAR